MMKPRLRKQKKENESGQAMIEFLLVVSMIFTLTFVFVQLAWGIAFGHYVHYATFMAARSYMAGGTTKSDQAEAAISSLKSFVNTAGGKDLFPFIAKARTGSDRDATGPEPVQGAAIGLHSKARGNEKSRAYSWAEGVQYNFNLKLFLLPSSAVIAKDGDGKTIQPGSAQEPSKSITFKGAIPFTSDSFLGRESSNGECWSFMTRMSGSFGIGRLDNREFIEDNGC